MAFEERRRFTREEYERMRALNIFAGQRIELADGDLIDRTPVNPHYSAAVESIRDYLTGKFGAEKVFVQAPVEVAKPDRERNLPEPDLSVRQGDRALLAVEIAECAAAWYATVRRELYARAGVPEYWLIDLPGRKVTAYRGDEVEERNDLALLLPELT
jgi:Uma2 family endonuclease